MTIAHILSIKGRDVVTMQPHRLVSDASPSSRSAGSAPWW